jgi:hypothetical protein
LFNSFRQDMRAFRDEEVENMHDDEIKNLLSNLGQQEVKQDLEKTTNAIKYILDISQKVTSEFALLDCQTCYKNNKNNTIFNCGHIVCQDCMNHHFKVLDSKVCLVCMKKIEKPIKMYIE